MPVFTFYSVHEIIISALFRSIVVVKPNHVVVFDFGGTLTLKESSTFDSLEATGALTPEAVAKAKKDREKYIAKFSNCELTPEEAKEWLRNTAKLYAEDGLTKAKIYQALQPIDIRKGVRECLRFLKQNNVPVAVVSYGFDDFIHLILLTNKVSEFVDAVYATELIFCEKGIVTGLKEETFVLPNNKGTFSCRFANLFNVDFENILAVGDSWGDFCLGYKKENSLGIAKDEKEKESLEKLMGKVIITEDFKPVQQWLGMKIGVSD